MKISHRLYLTALPSVFGVLAVAGLAYWGQYARTVPNLILTVAGVAVVVSLILSWRNARHVAHRIERLAGANVGTASDELARIEGVVEHLSSAVTEAEVTRSEHQVAADQRLRDYATMLVSVATDSLARLEEVRLPLHILLENHFGDLNENQEEMLGAARSSAEAVDADLVALRQIAELDLGTRPLRRDRLLPGDLVRSLVPTLQAIANHRHATLAVDVEPLVPAIRGDEPQLQDALAATIGGGIRAAEPGGELRLAMTREGAQARIELHGGGRADQNLRLRLALRTLGASGGSVSQSDGTLTIQLPIAGAMTK